MTICVTNIQMEAAISSLRRPSLSTKAIAPKVAATFTAQHDGSASAYHTLVHFQLYAFNAYSCTPQ